MKKSIIILAAVLALWAIAPGLTPAGPPPRGPLAEAPRLKTGDEWTWKLSDRTVSTKVLGMEGDFVVTTSTNPRCNGCKQYRDRNLTVVRTTGGGPTDLKHFDFPLYVGKTWKYDSLMVSSQGRTFSYDNRCKVVAFEKVTVPAGAFKGFKIKCDSHSDGGWWGQLAYWYVPKVKGVVKMSDLSKNFWSSPEMELISYSVE